MEYNVGQHHTSLYLSITKARNKRRETIRRDYQSTFKFWWTNLHSASKPHRSVFIAKGNTWDRRMCQLSTGSCTLRIHWERPRTRTDCNQSSQISAKILVTSSAGGMHSCCDAEKLTSFLQPPGSRDSSHSPRYPSPKVIPFQLLLQLWILITFAGRNYYYWVEHK